MILKQQMTAQSENLSESGAKINKNKNKKERKQCEKEHKEEHCKHIHIMNDYNPYNEDIGISNNEWFELDHKQDLLEDKQQQKERI